MLFNGRFTVSNLIISLEALGSCCCFGVVLAPKAEIFQKAIHITKQSIPKPLFVHSLRQYQIMIF